MIRLRFAATHSNRCVSDCCTGAPTWKEQDEKKLVAVSSSMSLQSLPIPVLTPSRSRRVKKHDVSYTESDAEHTGTNLPHIFQSSADPSTVTLPGANPLNLSEVTPSVADLSNLSEVSPSNVTNVNISDVKTDPSGVKRWKVEKATSTVGQQDVKSDLGDSSIGTRPASENEGAIKYIKPMDRFGWYMCTLCGCSKLQRGKTIHCHLQGKKHRFNLEQISLSWNQNSSGPVASNDSQQRRQLSPFDISDHQIMSIHCAICPSDDELEFIQVTVRVVEQALGLVGDSLNTCVLQNYVRVGPFAKKLLLRGEREIHLVALLSVEPTWSLHNSILSRLKTQLRILVGVNEYSVMKLPEKTTIVIERSAPRPVTCHITLTSPSILDWKSDNPKGLVAGHKDLVLDYKRCVAALAEYERTKWFLSTIGDIPSCLVLLRLLRDLCRRVPAWSFVTDWMLEVLVEKCMLRICGLESMSLANALQHVLEYIASGILLTGSPELLDPCERYPTDVFRSLTMQQRKAITRSAQLGLQLIA